MTGSPPKLAFDLERDIEILSEMAANLTPYLYEDEMYGYLPGNLPRLTLGGLLLRLYRLTAIENDLKPDQQTTIQDARLNFEAECSKWAVHYEKKLQRELTSRLNALEQYLRECPESRATCAAGYPIQAEKRTMIEHLKTESEDNNVLTDELGTRIKETDQRINRLSQTGEFIYVDDRLLAAYPLPRFWWLHSHIAEEEA